ncbi:MAG: hypothetical protein ACK5DD_07680 [Cyclobacteriaceae bacterium]|jgi:hypothetical protein
MNCPNCKSPYNETEKLCVICGFPLTGTDAEKSKFIGQQVLKEGVISESKSALQRAQMILFFIGGINCLLGLIGGLAVPEKVVIIALGVLFLTFGLLLKKSPKFIMSTALLLLTLSYLFTAFSDPSLLLRGIFWKFLYIGSLGYGLYAIYRAEKLRKESEYLNQK